MAEAYNNSTISRSLNFVAISTGPTGSTAIAGASDSSNARFAAVADITSGSLRPLLATSIREATSDGSNPRRWAKVLKVRAAEPRRASVAATHPWLRNRASQLRMAATSRSSNAGRPSRRECSRRLARSPR
jgi:hypothetical protein